ncbi:MAG: LysM peptidoglycan-binding domain-containing protein [Lachnospiraceae bacterium]|jgi:LysM repeat protein|nr:LysM peptidoglycan-binding domain-containing protein [Eubacterium sp.]MCI9617725.1 LysM peptidoglycan-binding domain-containing protein [Eubacterium sp.]MCX4267542.1 LysM peptidoglycan-binding domain-containing protein [Lachnospiraceae bacterium]
MIEMVYSSKESQEQENVIIPKNIRQMGENDSNQKIYIEDNVMTLLRKKTQNPDDIKYGVLLGEIKRKKNNTYVFVKAMVEVRDIIENSLIFNDDIWSDIYKDIKKFFGRMDIVGWFVSVPYRVRDDLKGIRKLHMDNFAGNDKICFLSDRTENDESFYMCRRGKLEKQKGYYIYYEKNEKMKKYMKSMNNEKREEKPVENNKVEIKEKPTNESKSFREILKEEGQTVKQGRVAYGISGLLIVALLLSTVVMLNNYGELKNIKQTLAGYSMDEEARVVNQMLNGEDATTQLATVNQTTTIGRETEPVTQEPESTEIETTSMIEKMTTKSKQKPVNNNVTGTTYTVKKGQTLYDISMKVYGTSQMVEEIRKYNDIDEDYKIIEGQKIKLP